MAKTPVKIEIDGYNEREVLMVTYSFERETDVEGQLTGIPRGGRITVRVKAMNDGTPELMAWMVDKALPKDGTITFNETKTGKKMKDIQFKTAYCIDYHEHWGEGDAHYEEFTITCKDIIFNGAEYHNDWK